jgi:hypothetical protein
MASWKETVRKGLLGDRVPLAVTGGTLWIRPRKYSQEAADEIRALMRPFYLGTEAKAKEAKLQALKDRLEAEGKKLADADPLELIEATPEMPSALKVAANRLYLRHGVGEYGRADGGKQVAEGEALPEELLEEMMGWGELAEEAAGVVEAWNRPLASPTSPS